MPNLPYGSTSEAKKAVAKEREALLRVKKQMTSAATAEHKAAISQWVGKQEERLKDTVTKAQAQLKVQKAIKLSQTTRPAGFVKVDPNHAASVAADLAAKLQVAKADLATVKATAEATKPGLTEEKRAVVDAQVLSMAADTVMLEKEVKLAQQGMVNSAGPGSSSGPPTLYTYPGSGPVVPGQAQAQEGAVPDLAPTPYELYPSQDAAPQPEPDVPATDVEAIELEEQLEAESKGSGVVVFVGLAAAAALTYLLWPRN